MRLAAPALVLPLAVVFVAGCHVAPASGALDMTSSVAKDASGEWEHVVRDHTRQVEIYNWTIREVDMRATVVTPRLRSAFIAARERLHGRAAHDWEDDLLKLGKPPDEGVDAPMMKGPDAEEQVIVFLCFYVTDQKFRDLAASYTVWDTHLVRGAARVKPTSMSEEPWSPALAALLPHVDRFDDIYILRFPLVDAKTGTAMLSPGGEPLRLELDSAIANAATEWTLTGG
jgi:hypothetical protein